MKPSIRTLVFLLSLMFCFSHLNMSAQTYYQGIGLTYNIGFDNSHSSGSGEYDIYGLYYVGTLAYDIGIRNQFGLSSYPMAGISCSSIGFETPVLAEIYFGDIAYRNFHLGLGYTYSFVYSYGNNNVILGPLIEIGGCFNSQGKIVNYRFNFAFNPGSSNSEDLSNSTNGLQYKLGVGVYMHL